MESNRRNFLASAGAVTAAAAVSGAFSPMNLNAKQSGEAAGELTEHKLPPLPYAYDALEPYIDSQTLQIHHDKHHQGYINGLNAAEKSLAEIRADGDYSKIQFWERKLAFHGAGAYLHSVYWKSMTPNSTKKPGGELMKKINRDFGSYEKFTDQFNAAAKAVEGSGWCLLAHRPVDDRLLVLQIENHQKLTTWNVSPILVLDVWEHAYYLKYQNKRGDYISNWWNIVNWDYAAKMLETH